MRFIWVLLLLLLAVADRTRAVESAIRSTPEPLTGHPGNIFVAGEEVVVRVPAGQTPTWRVLDYDDHEVASASQREGLVSLGRLDVGFYRLRQDGPTNWISCAVLAPLKASTPLSSPIALDVAMAWFYPKDQMDGVASLCALAGVNWVRDRLAWGQMEAKPGQWSDPNRHDASALAQSRAGLQVLQVNHSSPSWANQNTSRFPLDLRDAYRFYREMARRWQGRVLAFEPWNEADIPGFGGHTGSEMAAMQKASFLGLKAGAPNTIACLNVFAMHNLDQLADLNANQAWPYFDTFNLHHYAPFDEYPKLYADFRAVSAGKPLWVTECALPVPWSGDEKLKEPSDADLRVQAERVAKTFACSLHEGAVETFYFLLPHYVEGQTQFGLVRPDFSPRPGYVALAAVGRLLADARPLGQLRSTMASVRGYLFRAKPEGQSRNVLVAWTTEGRGSLSLPGLPDAVFDHLGRARISTAALDVSSAPVFAIIPDDMAKQLELRPPPKAPGRLPGEASPVVIQLVWPEDRIVLSKSAYRLSSERRESIPLFAYNFSDAPVSGRLSVLAPDGWETGGFDQVNIAPQSRTELRLELDCRKGAPRFLEAVRITGSFGPAGNAVLSMRVIPEPNLLVRQTGRPLLGTGDTKRWSPTISGHGPIKISAQDGTLLVEAEPLGPDKWVYPLLQLPADHRPPPGTAGLCCTLTLLEGEIKFRAIFDEANGSSYVVDFLDTPKPGETIEAAALFENATFGAGWSKPDPNHRLDPGEVISLKIGCNTKSGKVKFAIKNLRWVKY